MPEVEICNHVIYMGVDIVAAKHLSQNEIHERQHYNCNIASDGEPPFCGNCMFSAYDTETNTSYCMMSRR